MQESATNGVNYAYEVRRYVQNLQRAADRIADLLGSYWCLLLILFSICYFVATCYRASRKLFWFDELFTVYISNLPSVGAMWQALLHGADFNPPLLYLLTRWSESIFGHTQLGTRFPEIIGFWIFCLCLFRFVFVRSNALAGLIAMLFPMVTTAYWYSYEARSHGLVLGFCGLALVCWQGVASKRNRRYWWLVGLAASLAAAMLTHSYAFLLLVPIGIGELTRTIFNRHIDWPVWLTIAVSSSTALISLPLLHAVHATYGSHFFPASLRSITEAYRSLFEPALNVLIISLVLLCANQFIRRRSLDGAATRDPFTSSKVQSHEWAAILGSLLVPFVCFLASRMTGAPMLQRYSLQTVVCVACLLGLAAARSAALGTAIALCLLAQIGADLSRFLDSHVIPEPSTSIPLSKSYEWFNQRYEWIASDTHANLPVVLLSDLEFSPTFCYAPAEILSRLVYIPTDENGEEYLQLQNCCHAPGKVLSLQNLLSRSKSFLAYGPPRSFGIIEYFRRTGASVSIERISGDYSLFLVEYPPGKATANLELRR